MPSADDRWGAGSHDAKTRSEERARKNGGPTRRSGLDVRMVRTYAGTRETRALCPLRIGPYSLLCVGIGFFTSVISVCICRGIGQSRWHVSRPQMARAKMVPLGHYHNYLLPSWLRHLRNVRQPDMVTPSKRETLPQIKRDQDPPDLFLTTVCSGGQNVIRQRGSSGLSTFLQVLLGAVMGCALASTRSCGHGDTGGGGTCL